MKLIRPNDFGLCVKSSHKMALRSRNEKGCFLQWWEAYTQIHNVMNLVNIEAYPHNFAPVIFTNTRITLV